LEALDFVACGRQVDSRLFEPARFSDEDGAPVDCCADTLARHGVEGFGIGVRDTAVIGMV